MAGGLPQGKSEIYHTFSDSTLTVREKRRNSSEFLLGGGGQPASPRAPCAKHILFLICAITFQVRCIYRLRFVDGETGSEGMWPEGCLTAREADGLPLACAASPCSPRLIGGGQPCYGPEGRHSGKGVSVSQVSKGAECSPWE